jgi:hypothetical protein
MGAIGLPTATAHVAAAISYLGPVVGLDADALLDSPPESHDTVDHVRRAVRALSSDEPNIIVAWAHLANAEYLLRNRLDTSIELNHTPAQAGGWPLGGGASSVFAHGVGGAA